MAVADEQDDVFDEKLDFIDCARYGEIDEVQAKLNANKTLAMSVDDRKNNGVLFIWSYIAFTCPLCFHLVFFCCAYHVQLYIWQAPMGTKRLLNSYSKVWTTIFEKL